MSGYQIPGAAGAAGMAMPGLAMGQGMNPAALAAQVAAAQSGQLTKANSAQLQQLAGGGGVAMPAVSTPAGLQTLQGMLFCKVDAIEAFAETVSVLWGGSLCELWC